MWIDCEMTGLDPVADALVEIAVLVTDPELNVLGEGVDIVIRPPQEALDQMVPFVRDMHTSSGLLERLPDGASLAEASEACLAYITEHCPDPGKAVLADVSNFATGGVTIYLLSIPTHRPGSETADLAPADETA